MKQPFYLLILLVLLAKTSFTNAQITYQATDYGAAGDTFLLSFVTEDLTNVNFLSTGANQTWNYSQLRVNTQAKEAFLGDTGYYFSFLTSCLATGGGFGCFETWTRLVDFGVTDFNGFEVLDYGVSNVVRHQKKQNNVLREGLLGLTVQTGGLNTPLTIRYTNADTIFRFPLNYQNRHSDYSEWTFDLRFLGIDLVYKHTQTRTYTVDGWGALTTPFRRYDSTLRVQTEIQSRDTIVAYGNVVPTATRVINLAWFAKDTKRPVLEVFGAPLDSANQQFVPLRVAFVDEPRCLPPDISFLPVPPVALLNPRDTLVVDFLATSQNVDRVTWNFGDGSPSVSTAGNPRHTYRAPGAYNVTAVGCNSNCNPLRCDTFNFTLNLINPNQPVPIFTVNPFASRCVGDSVGFINLSINARTYRWDFGDGTVDTAASPTHLYRNPGNYTVKLTTENTGVTAETTSTLTIGAAPPAPFARADTSIRLRDTLLLRVPTYPSIRWQDGSTAPTFWFVAAAYGVGRHLVIVTVADTVGCSTRDTIFVNVIHSTSVQEMEVTSRHYRVYPNPAKDLLQIASVSSDFTLVGMVVTDVLGKVVQQQQFSTPVLKTELNLAALPPGLYLVQVHSDKALVGVYKIVKE